MFGAHLPVAPLTLGLFGMESCSVPNDRTLLQVAMRSAEELGKAIEERSPGPGDPGSGDAAQAAHHTAVAGRPPAEAGAGGASEGSSGRLWVSAARGGGTGSKDTRVLSWECLCNSFSFYLRPSQRRRLCSTGFLGIDTERGNC